MSRLLAAFAAPALLLAAPAMAGSWEPASLTRFGTAACAFGPISPSVRLARMHLRASSGLRNSMIFGTKRTSGAKCPFSHVFTVEV